MEWDEVKWSEAVKDGKGSWVGDSKFNRYLHVIYLFISLSRIYTSVTFALWPRLLYIHWRKILTRVQLTSTK